MCQEGGNIHVPKPARSLLSTRAVTQHQLRCPLACDGTSTKSSCATGACYWIQEEGNTVCFNAGTMDDFKQAPVFSRCTQQNLPCSTQSTLRVLYLAFENHLNKTGNETGSIYTYGDDHFQLAYQLLHHPMANYDKRLSFQWFIWRLGIG